VLILGPGRKTDVEYVEVCRKRRNVIEYDSAGTVTDKDATELIALVAGLRRVVIEWLRGHHPELLSA
jgi:hypothetical protein